MEAHDSAEFREGDERIGPTWSRRMGYRWVAGVPLRMLGVRGATRVYGPDLTPVVLAAAAEAGDSGGIFMGGARRLCSRSWCGG